MWFKSDSSCSVWGNGFLKKQTKELQCMIRSSLWVPGDLPHADICRRLNCRLVTRAGESVWRRDVPNKRDRQRSLAPRFPAQAPSFRLCKWRWRQPLFLQPHHRLRASVTESWKIVPNDSHLWKPGQVFFHCLSYFIVFLINLFNFI